MDHWPEYRGQLRPDDCLSDIRNDTPPSQQPSSSSSLSLAVSAAVTSACIDDVTSRCAPSGGGELCRRPVSLGLKKCFHCAHCRYSTDRKNNLKRHLGTMHRDHYVGGVLQLDQSKYHVSIQRRHQSCSEDFGGRSPLNRRHSVLLDDFARTADVIVSRCDVDSAARNDDIINLHETTAQLSSSETDDVSARNGDVTPSSIAAQGGDVSTGGTQSPIADYRSALPRFEPRPATAYGRHSSRMFFYDRLRSTHDYNVTGHPVS